MFCIHCITDLLISFRSIQSLRGNKSERPPGACPSTLTLTHTLLTVWFYTTWTNQLHCYLFFSKIPWIMATTHSPSLSASLSLFDFHMQNPFTSRTVVAWRVRISPCVGYSCDQVASIGFTQEILSLKLTTGIFEFHSLSFFFFTRHKTTFKGVDAVRQTNYCPPTAGGRVPYDSSLKHAVMKEDWCTRVCHRLLVSWLAPLRQTLHSFFLHSSLFTKGGKRLRVEILPLVAVGFLLLFVLSTMKGRTL